MASDDLTKPLENGHLARILDEFAALRAEFRSGLQALDGKVEALDSKVEARLTDTRPLWEGVQTQLRALREELHSDMSKGFRDLGRRVGVLSRDIVEVRATEEAFDERLSVLEK